MKSTTVDGKRPPAGEDADAAKRDSADGENCGLRREADEATEGKREEREGDGREPSWESSGEHKKRCPVTTQDSP